MAIGVVKSVKGYAEWKAGDEVKFGKKIFSILSARPDSKLNLMLAVNRGRQYYIAAYPDGSIGYPIKVSRR